jgi:hypothetical protein
VCDLSWHGSGGSGAVKCSEVKKCSVEVMTNPQPLVYHCFGSSSSKLQAPCKDQLKPFPLYLIGDLR